MDFPGVEMLFKLLLVVVCVFVCADAVRYTKRGPTLSDPLNLDKQQPEEMWFGPGNGTGGPHGPRGHMGYNYVSGSVWPKPQKETRGKNVFTLDPKKFE